MFYYPHKNSAMPAGMWHDPHITYKDYTLDKSSMMDCVWPVVTTRVRQDILVFFIEETSIPQSFIDGVGEPMMEACTSFEPIINPRLLSKKPTNYYSFQSNKISNIHQQDSIYSFGGTWILESDNKNHFFTTAKTIKNNRFVRGLSTTSGTTQYGYILKNYKDSLMLKLIE